MRVRMDRDWGEMQVAEQAFEVNGVDRRFYEQELAPWLPSRILDCHVHVGLGEGARPISPERYKAMWALEVGCHQSWRRMRETYRALFPEQEVSVLAFANVYNEIDTQRENEYIFDGIADERNRAEGLFVTRPGTTCAEIRHAFAQGFVGIKPYPDLIDGISMEVSIFQFLPHSHLEVVNELGGIVMLHLPRSGRLADPSNTRELVEISERYGRIKLIVAHVGRAYCLPTVERGLPPLVEHRRILFDVSANVNREVFLYTLKAVGPERVLFGTDMPVMLMRGVREHVGEHYINHTDGPYSWNRHRRSPEEEANYTFYVYQQIKALIWAVRQAGWGRDVLEKIMYSNAARLLGARTAVNQPAEPSIIS